ncbi:WYL domain-containing protein [Bacillus sp. T3]|uniref:helix-turn-helix transcriptional regulator n=1 Tax=Bacillus sp. T3 TaxID=467262 RepID=UPI0029821447|nr:WYL domain-containing protein [Bacillus sp. T3]
MSKELKLSSKQRLLKLQNLMSKYTDQERQLTLDEILDKFYQEYKIHAGKKAIRDDLKELEDSLLFNVTVNQEKEGLEKKYSHQDRLFEIHELRMLVDAVSAAKFISNAETESLVNKINQLTSENQAQQLTNRIYLPENAKNENQQIKYSIHELHIAISNLQTIRFQYGKYDLNKKFKLSRNGDYYSVKPYALVWNHDFYYLIGEYLPEEEIRHYRVDRMRNVTATEEKFQPDPDFNKNKYTEKLFHMYSGEEHLVEIEFDAGLINVVIDHFGRGVSIRQVGENSFRISTQAITSDGLVKWLLTWGCEAKVLTPPSLVERMKEEAEKLYKKYHG